MVNQRQLAATLSRPLKVENISPRRPLSAQNSPLIDVNFSYPVLRPLPSTQQTLRYRDICSSVEAAVGQERTFNEPTYQEADSEKTINAGQPRS